MAERFVELVCPKCKSGVQYDSLTGTVKHIPVSDYPEINEAGRCWCKACQHGTYPDSDGLCMECRGKGRATRLRPVTEPVKVVKVEPKLTVVNQIEEVNQDVLTLAKATPKPKTATKTVVGKTQ